MESLLTNDRALEAQLFILVDVLERIREGHWHALSGIRLASNLLRSRNLLILLSLSRMRQSCQFRKVLA